MKLSYYYKFHILFVLLVGIYATNSYSENLKRQPKSAAKKVDSKKTVKDTKKPEKIAPHPSPTPNTSTSIFNTQELDLTNEPTNISATTLTLYNDKRTFTYQGSVVVTQGDLTLNSDFLDGSYSDKNEIEKIIARTNIIITKGVDIKATGQRAEYDAKTKTIVLTETPSIEQNGSILTADLIRVYIDVNKSIAEGNVKVTLKNTDQGLPDKKPAQVSITKTNG